MNFDKWETWQLEQAYDDAIEAENYDLADEILEELNERAEFLAWLDHEELGFEDDLSEYYDYFDDEEEAV